MILILILLVGSILIYNRVHAKSVINNYIVKQGIEKSQLNYTDFHKDFKMGGYFLNTYVDGENPNIYYSYHYYDGRVYFEAYELDETQIRKQFWGGNNLEENKFKKLKYPPH